MCAWLEFFKQVDHTKEYALITEFSVTDSLISATVMKPEDLDNGETPIPNLSWLNIAHCKCNCSNFPERGHVLVNRDDGDIYNTVRALVVEMAMIRSRTIPVRKIWFYMPKDLNCEGAHSITSFSLPSKTVN